MGDQRERGVELEQAGQAALGDRGVVADDAIAGVVSCAAFHALRFALVKMGYPLLG